VAGGRDAVGGWLPVTAPQTPLTWWRGLGESLSPSLLSEQKWVRGMVGPPPIWRLSWVWYTGKAGAFFFCVS